MGHYSNIGLRKGWDDDEARSGRTRQVVAARPANIRKMAWLMPRMAKAVPYLGYVLVASEKPR